jgi:hypothetical protein
VGEGGGGTGEETRWVGFWEGSGKRCRKGPPWVPSQTTAPVSFAFASLATPQPAHLPRGADEAAGHEAAVAAAAHAHGTEHAGRHHLRHAGLADEAPQRARQHHRCSGGHAAGEAAHAAVAREGEHRARRAGGGSGSAGRAGAAARRKGRAGCERAEAGSGRGGGGLALRAARVLAPRALDRLGGHKGRACNEGTDEGRQEKEAHSRHSIPSAPSSTSGQSKSNPGRSNDAPGRG